MAALWASTQRLGLAAGWPAARRATLRTLAPSPGPPFAFRINAVLAFENPSFGFAVVPVAGKAG